jgi:anti-sigma factor RsiW
MKTNLSNQDWELLSAYIDGELSSAKSEHLEARVQSNPDLRAALEDLSRTRAMLRSLPRLKAPRSFKLTPEMAGQRQPRRLYPIFQFASALSSLMLILVLLSDFLGFGFQGPFAQMASQAPEEIVVEEVLVESFVESMAAEMPAEEEADARKVLPSEEDQLVEKAQVEEEMVMGTPGLEATAEVGAYLAAPAAPAVPEEEAANLLMEAADVPPDMTAESELPAEMPAPALQTSESETDQEHSAVDQTTSEEYSSMRILQISLALVALGSAFLAIYLRRIGG